MVNFIFISANYGQNTFCYKGSALWNVISKDIREVNSLLCFKLQMKHDHLKLNHFFSMFMLRFLCVCIIASPLALLINF